MGWPVRSKSLVDDRSPWRPRRTGAGILQGSWRDRCCQAASETPGPAEVGAIAAPTPRRALAWSRMWRARSTCQPSSVRAAGWTTKREAEAGYGHRWPVAGSAAGAGPRAIASATWRQVSHPEGVCTSACSPATSIASIGRTAEKVPGYAAAIRRHPDGRHLAPSDPIVWAIAMVESATGLVQAFLTYIEIVVGARVALGLLEEISPRASLVGVATAGDDVGPRAGRPRTGSNDASWRATSVGATKPGRCASAADPTARSNALAKAATWEFR